MKLKPSLDLNLLPVLVAPVQHRSATRAAAALGLAQPRVSRSLAQLRAEVGDPQFVRRAGGLEPTQIAVSLSAACAPALRHAAALSAKRMPFDPSAATEFFRLSMNDYESAVMLPALFTALRREAPSARLAVISHPSGEVATALEIGRLELAIGRFVKPQGTLRHVEFFEEWLAAAVRIDHQITRGRITVDRFVAFPHVLVSPGGRGEFMAWSTSASRRVAPLVAAPSVAVVVLPTQLLQLVAGWGSSKIRYLSRWPDFGSRC